MILHGKDLIILADGVPLAASRSCSIDVDADLIKVSSTSDGSWEHSIVGMKSWKVSTNHLLKSATAADGYIEAVAIAHNGAGVPGPSVIRTSGGSESVTSRGLTAWFVYNQSPYAPMGQEYSQTFDTYGDIQQAGESAMSSMASWLNTMCQMMPSYPLVIVSNDAFGMNGTLRSTIEGLLNVDLSMVPSERSRGSLVVIYGGSGKGIASYVPPVNGAGSQTYCRMWMNNAGPVTDYTMKNMLLQVGKTVDLRMQVDGFPNDTLHGSAICKSCRITATKGSLAQGAFSWEGSGPLT